MKVVRSVLLGVCVIGVTSLQGCATLEQLVDSSDADGTGFNVVGASYTCKDLATEAVRVSGEQESPLRLLKVRNPRVVKDRQSSYDLPAGNGESLLISCRGQGVWSVGVNSPVVIKATIDSDGDEWIRYEGM